MMWLLFRFKANLRLNCPMAAEDDQTALYHNALESTREKCGDA